MVKIGQLYIDIDTSKECYYTPLHMYMYSVSGSAPVATVSTMTRNSLIFHKCPNSVHTQKNKIRSDYFKHASTRQCNMAVNDSSSGVWVGQTVLYPDITCVCVDIHFDRMHALLQGQMDEIMLVVLPD